MAMKRGYFGDGEASNPRWMSIFGFEQPNELRVSIRHLMKRPCFVQFVLLGTCALLFCSCEEMQQQMRKPLAAVLPTPAPGWWNDEVTGGEPRIIVHIGEQKAYFYKGKQLAGESTVSTGKPGFSTPPGHYTVLDKDRNHVSTVFGDYIDSEGNIVKQNIDSRKDSRPRGTHFDGARMPYAMFFRSG